MHSLQHALPVSAQQEQVEIGVIDLSGSPAADVRAAPDDDFIGRIRAAYPVEAEIDRVLTRKLRGRGGPEYAPVPLDGLVEGVAALIPADIGDRFSLRNPPIGRASCRDRVCQYD